MAPQNGEDREGENTRVLISLVSRLNDALRDFSVEQRLSSERLARLESAVDKAREAISRIEHGVDEARDDIEATREQTDPRGFKLLDPAKYPLQSGPYREPAKNDSGKLVALARVAEKVPTPWVAGLLKLGLSSGLGALGLRLIQWLANGH